MDPNILNINLSVKEREREKERERRREREREREKRGGAQLAERQLFSASFGVDYDMKSESCCNELSRVNWI